VSSIAPPGKQTFKEDGRQISHTRCVLVKMHTRRVLAESASATRRVMSEDGQPLIQTLTTLCLTAAGKMKHSSGAVSLKR